MKAIIGGLMVSVATMAGPRLPQASDSDIDAYLEVNRPDGSGPAMILARDDGHLAGSPADETAVLYRYQIGESRDRSGRQYLVVFTSFGRPIPHRVVGAIGLQYFTELQIEDGEILLEGMAWDFPDDAMCCPSLPAELRYAVLGGEELVAVTIP